MLKIILLANAVWFGLGFHLFALRNRIFAKILVPREHRDTPVLDVLAASGPFLGGFNFAFCIFNILLLIYASAFQAAEQIVILCVVFALAHGSQFLPNLIIAIKNRRGEGAWQVKGLVRFIFFTDFALMVANAVLAISYAS